MSATERTPEFHTLHEAADRLDHYLDTYEPSRSARIAGHQLSDDLRRLAGSALPQPLPLKKGQA